MIKAFQDIYAYRELIAVLTWKNVILRYKQSYLGLCWAIFKPVLLMLMFIVVRSFVGIETSGVPYPVMTFAALLPWTFFQESTADGINSVVSNAALVKKIYFPREIFPLSVIFTKLFELGIHFIILAVLMLYYKMVPTVYAFGVPLIIVYAVLISTSVGLVGSALNVYYRDVATGLPLLLSLLMYLSPVIYPLDLVKNTLLVKHAAGIWSDPLYFLYMLNPLSGVIDSFQKSLLYGQPPDLISMLPGLILTLVSLPLSYLLFKKAEAYFADVI